MAANWWDTLNTKRLIGTCTVTSYFAEDVLGSSVGHFTLSLIQSDLEMGTISKKVWADGLVASIITELHKYGIIPSSVENQFTRGQFTLQGLSKTLEQDILDIVQKICETNLNQTLDRELVNDL